jgi:hypothetical protein
MTQTDQVLCGDPAEAGTYECVDCGNRMDLASSTEAMCICDCDEGHHKSHAWQRVAPDSLPRAVPGEASPPAGDQKTGTA